MVKKILGAVALIIVELAIIVGVFVIAQRRFPASSLPEERAAETAQATPIPSGKALWIYYGSSGDWKCTFQLLPARYAYRPKARSTGLCTGICCLRKWSLRPEGKL